MSELSVANARKSFGGNDVLANVSLEVTDREFVVIVGPSGCGKSTFLRTIAGLEQLDSGSIKIGGRDVTALPPAERGIAMVFQSYALYPHLNVFENMAFALRMSKMPQGEIDQLVGDAATLLGIEALLDRKPAALSGGQRQRVAIGRAIVRKPKLFLFDEPLSNLDAGLRVRMRYEFAALHKRLGTTTLYVTHDQVEAMTLADRIVVMRDGHVQQIGTPNQVYKSPANIFVARFLGSTPINVMPARIVFSDQGMAARLDSGATLALPQTKAKLTEGTPVSIGIRPEDIRIGTGNGLRLPVHFVERLGGLATIHLEGRNGWGDLLCHARDDGSVTEGTELAVEIATDQIHIFDSKGNSVGSSGP